MADVLAENISDKAVMGSDGTQIGTTYNVTMNVETGRLNHLLVTPSEDLPHGKVNFDRDDGGRFQVPVSQVQAVKDYIVVQR